MFITNTQEIGHEATQQVMPDPTQEAVQEMEMRRPIRTQGRKGKKKPRINMAFDPEIYDYIKKQAVLQDKSLTQLVNDIIYSKMSHKG